MIAPLEGGNKLYAIRVQELLTDRMIKNAVEQYMRPGSELYPDCMHFKSRTHVKQIRIDLCIPRATIVNFSSDIACFPSRDI